MPKNHNEVIYNISLLAAKRDSKTHAGNVDRDRTAHNVQSDHDPCCRIGKMYPPPPKKLHLK